jgi:hypothetical protein
VDTPRQPKPNEVKKRILFKDFNLNANEYEIKAIMKYTFI